MDSAPVQFVILGLAVCAFILAIKTAAGMLPDAGILGAGKAVIKSI